jgi:acyl-CoA hydrolase
VALDEDGRPRPVAPIEVTSQTERRRQRAAKLRRAARMQHKEALRAEHEASRSSSG